MVHDRKANPRIRTKIANLDDDIDAAFFELIENLRAGTIDVDTFQSQTLACFSGFIAQGRMDAAAGATSADNSSSWLLKRHIDHRRYSVLCYRVNNGEAHPPHHHHNLISSQILLHGKLHLREYERVKRNSDGTLVLKLASDAIIGPGDQFCASEWSRNVHWFCAVDGPAIIFNTNVRGFEHSTFDTDLDKFGRLYVDPTHYREDGLIETREFDEVTAHDLFGRRSLEQFPVPHNALQPT